MRNPKDEPPVKMKECPVCEGWGVLYRNERMLRRCCDNCNGEGEVEEDSQDAADDAGEARWEAARGK